VVWHHSLPLINSFNKTEAAVFSCRLCFLRAFPFISLKFLIDCLGIFSLNKTRQTLECDRMKQRTVTQGIYIIN